MVSRDQDLSVDSQQPQDLRPSEGNSDGVPASFKEDAYQLAFPDVAQAISNGLCKTPLQHYMEHGRHEDRLSHRNYLRILSRAQIPGHINSYGFNSVAAGWIFCGVVSEDWDQATGVTATVHFRSGDISGAGCPYWLPAPLVETAASITNMTLVAAPQAAMP
jgi:hypothetical protein